MLVNVCVLFFCSFLILLWLHFLAPFGQLVFLLFLLPFPGEAIYAIPPPPLKKVHLGTCSSLKFFCFSVVAVVIVVVVVVFSVIFVGLIFQLLLFFLFCFSLLHIIIVLLLFFADFSCFLSSSSCHCNFVAFLLQSHSCCFRFFSCFHIYC